MSFFAYALGAIVLILVLLRQARVVPVPRVYHARLPIILGVLGLLELTSYAGNHHVSSSAWAWVLGTMLVGALGLGALRGISMRVWTTNGWVVRQGNAATMALWLLSVLVHFVGDSGSTHSGGTALLGASFLLYLGLTLGMQYYLVYRRAQPLWARLGPNAGRPLQVHFTQGPGAFFATFRTGGAGPPGWVPPNGPAPAPDDDPNVIDAEVVEEDDDHGPPELPAPR
jgi:hypothetical protein